VTVTGRYLASSCWHARIQVESLQKPKAEAIHLYTAVLWKIPAYFYLMYPRTIEYVSAFK
jgi:hypothetical protein